MKKKIALMLSAALLVGVFAGCGGGTESTAVPASGLSAAGSASVEGNTPEAPAAVPEEISAEPSGSAVEEAPELTGAVIPAEECRAEGYDVQYGMYDFETYVELPRRMRT